MFPWMKRNYDLKWGEDVNLLPNKLKIYAIQHSGYKSDIHDK